MKSGLPKISIRRAAIVSGIAILIMTLAAVVATDLTIGPLVITDNPSVTVDNINTDQILFRIGIFSWLVVLICDLVIAWGLYIFFRPINKYISLVSAWLRLIYAAILGTSILNFTSVLTLLDSEFYSATFGQEFVKGQIWFLVNNFDTSWSFGLVIFGMHIFLLGYLGLKSDLIPRLLSVFLIIGSIGYLLINLFTLIIPKHQEFIQVLQWIFILPMLSEVALGFWLLFKAKRFLNVS